MAEEHPGAERTEAPTPRRREEARREGRVPRSQELSAVAVLLAGTAALATAGGAALGRHAVELLREDARWLAAGPLDLAAATRILRQVGRDALLAMAPVLGIVTAATLLVNLAQTRGVVSATPLTPKWAHLDPVAGLRRMVSLDALVSLLKAVLKLATLGMVTYLALHGGWEQLLALGHAGAREIVAVTRQLGVRLALATGVVFLALAAADYAYQRWRHEKSLRMTRPEVRREHKEDEGDPLIKSRMRSIAQARIRRQMLRDVPKADVVVTNPTHIAVALKYDPAAASAPVVLAMGQRKVAERIKAIARAAGVPCVENRPLARALLETAKVGAPIPPALYVAVAEVIAFVLRRRGVGPDGRGGDR
ncbi:MAG TPA: flagellar biosynthesis protein FlhB [Gemmatimonadales bacterium]|nr:flagellar biosynthesis protein FlhB [Gemmatimonadales bacterium]